MDERFRGKKHWIGLGVLVIIFLCLALCGLSAMATVVMRSGPAHGVAPHMQLQAGEEGAAPPGGHWRPMEQGGPWSPARFIFGGIRLLFGLAFFGLFLLLIAGLVRWVFWGPRRWGPPPWARPPQGTEGEGAPHAWGPWAWHHHGRYGRPASGPTGKEGEPQTAEQEGEPEAAEE